MNNIDKQLKAQNGLKTFIRFTKSIKQEYPRLIVVIISILFYITLTVITPLYTAYIINKIKDLVDKGQSFGVNLDNIGKNILLLASLYFLTWLFYKLQVTLMACFAEKVSLLFRKKISNKMNKMPLAYYDKHKVGDVLSRIVNDLDKTSEALQTGLLKLIVAIGTVIGSFCIMFYINYLLTIVFLCFSIVSLFLTKIISKKTLYHAKERQNNFSMVTSTLEELYTGRNIIKAFDFDEDSAQIVKKVTYKLYNSAKKANFFNNVITPMVRFINRIGYAVIAIFSCDLMIHGMLSVGIVVAFYQYINLIAEPLTQTSFMITTLQNSLAAIERVFKVLDEDEIKKEINIVDNSKLTQIKGEIEFKNVSFGYIKNQTLIQNLNFKALKGQKIAVVGSTGAGKTTIINLLMRFYEIDSGEILLDKINTKNIPVEKLRSFFGMVLQDTWLKEDTVANNIAYGKPNSTREEIINAAKQAKADKFIKKLPKGYDTLISQDINIMSIGQRQLLTIARIFLTNPKIIILDEATSSVDTKTEADITIAMNKLMKGRTSFVIAHRLSTILDADNILVMKDGNVIEQGNHEELMKDNGIYNELFLSQYR